MYKFLLLSSPFMEESLMAAPGCLQKHLCQNIAELYPQGSLSPEEEGGNQTFP